MTNPNAEHSGFDRAIEAISHGFVTPTLVSNGLISGCVYRGDGTKVGLSERFGGWKGDMYQSDNPDRVQRPSCVKQNGRGIYLGSLMAGHYGHFVTEGLSTFWVFETYSADKFDYFLFNPFVFGTGIPSFALQCMSTFGVDPQRIVIVGNEAIAFDELVVPERLFRLNHSADPLLAWVYRRIRSGIDELAEPRELIYLSRRRISLKNPTRVIANEVQIETLFRHAGFSVVYPEELAFEDQLALYANARVVAGPSGSALHNSLFMRPGTKLIELGDPRYGGERSPSQVLCDRVSRVDAAIIPFVGRLHDEKDSRSVDIDDLRLSLVRVLDSIGEPSPASRTYRSKTTIPEKAEIVYLTYRPLVGKKLKKLCGLLGINP